MRSAEIKSLTGLRIIAAGWVILFHFRPLLRQASPTADNVFGPLLGVGAQGVDLFFILSGYVLTYNYLDRMGERWTGRGTLRFLWLRLARVYPVYLVTMQLAGLWTLFTLKFGHVPSPGAGQLTALSYVKQLLLIQLWTQPYFDWSSWDGPAWSISAEWLAYLLFPLLVLVIFRMRRVTGARGLLWLAVAVTLPAQFLLVATGHFYTPWSWLLRITLQFAAGALACAAVRRMRITERLERVCGYLSVLLVGVLIGVLYLMSVHPVPRVQDCGGLVDVLFLPLVVTLAIGRGALPGLLSTRVFVYGGQISFSLYLVHEIVQAAYEWALAQFGLTMTGTTAKIALLGVLAFAVGLSMLLFRLVEEPARHWMRGMIGDARPDNRPPTQPSGGATQDHPEASPETVDNDIAHAPRPTPARAG